MMVYRFANINNDEFINGIVPKHAEKENYHALYPFGDERDLLFGKAVSLITGQPMVKARSQEQIPIIWRRCAPGWWRRGGLRMRHSSRVWEALPVGVVKRRGGVCGTTTRFRR